VSASYRREKLQVTARVQNGSNHMTIRVKNLGLISGEESERVIIPLNFRECSTASSRSRLSAKCRQPTLCNDYDKNEKPINPEARYVHPSSPLMGPELTAHHRERASPAERFGLGIFSGPKSKLPGIFFLTPEFPFLARKRHHSTPVSPVRDTVKGFFYWSTPVGLPSAPVQPKLRDLCLLLQHLSLPQPAYRRIPLPTGSRSAYPVGISSSAIIAPNRRRVRCPSAGTSQ